MEDAKHTDHQVYSDLGFYGCLWGCDDFPALMAFADSLKMQGLGNREISARIVAEAKRRGYVKQE